MNPIPDEQQLKKRNEIVYTVTDYYDGPRKGIANYNGAPHFYECLFDTANDDYSDAFQLTPIDQPTFLLAMEDWHIWLRWESAFYAGETTLETHPALPADAARHKELVSVLQNALITGPNAITRIGIFSGLGVSDLPRSRMRSLQVEWREL